MEKTSETREVDWLYEVYADKGAKDACVLAFSAAVQIARECCQHPLSLEEAQNLLETVWYELVHE